MIISNSSFNPIVTFKRVFIDIFKYTNTRSYLNVNIYTEALRKIGIIRYNVLIIVEFEFTFLDLNASISSSIDRVGIFIEAYLGRKLLGKSSVILLLCVLYINYT